MKINPSIADFPAAIVSACEAALDAGIFYNTEIDEYVLRHMGGFGCEAVLMEMAHLDAGTDDYAAQQRALHARLETAVSAAPRGHYAVIRISRTDGQDIYKTICSDGYGVGVATGGAYDVYVSMPQPETVLRRMVGYDIYLCRKVIEKEREHQAGREALAKYGISIGMTLRDIEVGGEKFSSAIVSKVHQGSGCVTLHLVRRGSRRRWESTMSATAVAERAKLEVHKGTCHSLEQIASAANHGQRSLFV